MRSIIPSSMYLRNEIMQEKKLAGKRLLMTFANNKTSELWKSFMPFRNQISNRVSTDLISLNVYGPEFDFTNFNPTLPFEKWALAEVSDFTSVPDGLESFVLETGLYAIFLHTGSPAEGHRTFEYIFGSWIPDSDFQIDTRPHFEVLGDRYIHDSPLSEEEIWIPIRQEIRPVGEQRSTLRTL